MDEKPIYVVQPYLPPLEEFLPYLEKIWASKILSNGGPMHQELEARLCQHLNVEHISLFNNGTNALLTALQALGIQGEVITTPYSFVATTHSLLWNGLSPVFVDIDPVTLNLDPRRIIDAITPQTTAIMPVHCYGHPCNVNAISEIAKEYGLKVIYDAAHAFGVEDQGGSILRHGDLAVLSFHATKVFNTFEGGAIVCRDLATKKRIDQLKNFGIVDEVTVDNAGLNGKMSEINAAFGLVQLEHISDVAHRRAEIDSYYRLHLASVQGITLLGTGTGVNVTPNHSYFPVLVEPNFPVSRDELYNKLKEAGVFARRYFYPLISDLPMYSGIQSAAAENLPVARSAAARILCLPIYPALTSDDLHRVVEVIAEVGG